LSTSVSGMISGACHRRTAGSPLTSPTVAIVLRNAPLRPLASIAEPGGQSHLGPGHPLDRDLTVGPFDPAADRRSHDEELVDPRLNELHLIGLKRAVFEHEPRGRAGGFPIPVSLDRLALDELVDGQAITVADEDEGLRAGLLERIPAQEEMIRLAGRPAHVERSRRSSHIG
jgi:hypothetical protein